MVAEAAPEGDPAGAGEFRRDIRPILQEFCFDCHGDGMDKGGVTFDRFVSDDAMLADHDLWLRALKNLRAGIMPPPKKDQPGAEQKQKLEAWIKSAVFRLDPAHPDPGRVTVRRLNRVEYRNTIRDLLGVDFDTASEFPADDSGHGFDNIGDALTLSPMLLEKYLAAAQTVVNRAVPAVPAVPAEREIAGRDFQLADTGNAGSTNTPAPSGTSLTLSYYDPVLATHRHSVTHAGRYQIGIAFSANERFVDNQFDYNRCRFTFRVDGEPLLRQEYSREGNRSLHYEFERDWAAGEHELELQVEPLTPDEKRVRSLTLRIESVTVRGPLEQKFWVKPANHERFFPKAVPGDTAARREYARELLTSFAGKAYRRPVDAATADRLVAVAESTFGSEGQTFEAGIGQAMVAVLASPRFLFREEAAAEPGGGTGHPFVDDYALASRLSYLFWSSMPDDELFRLAGEGTLRAHLAAQRRRMLEDPKSAAFIRNFVGQWLQTRDMETVQIDARQVLNREVVETAADLERERRLQRFRELRAREDSGEVALTPDEKKEVQEIREALFGAAAQGGRGFRGPRVELNGDLRRAMRQETEKVFEYVLRENRSLLELLDSDYTFLNERLARHYGLTNLNVAGEEMILVKLPADSPRGGVLTHGSVLVVTSNPTRTSPVKRGLFVLDNLLGTPPPPPPPDIPPLEEAAKAIKERKLSLRETLALHREAPLCSSCHNRMDPIGLALDHFNALGLWRDQEKGDPIDAAGTLLSGEQFTDVRELKKILAGRHSTEFYRTITEKLLTYALGRGLEYYDVATVDAIVARLEQSGGRTAEWLAGIVESAPFQRTRAAHFDEQLKPSPPVTPGTDARIPP